MRQLLILTFLLCLSTVLFGCQFQSRHTGQAAPPGKQFEPSHEEGQLPYSVLQSSSKRYGGALNDQGNDDTGAATAAGHTVSESAPLSVVLGPVSAANDAEGDEGDAGKRIREVISEQLSRMDGLILIDAPEERYNNDSPRPDLMAKGIRFVIKGSSSYNPENDMTTVFLRIVETRSGEVFGVASGRGANQDEAAGETTLRLIRKLERAQ